jgi:signal transduction histidine kinase
MFYFKSLLSLVLVLAICTTCAQKPDSVSTLMASKQVATLLKQGTTMSNNDADSSILLVKQALALSITHKLYEAQEQSLQLLSKAYANKGNDKEAIQYLNKALAAKDSAALRSTQQKIAALQSAFEKDKQEQLLLLQKAQLSKQRLIIIGLSALLLLTAILVIIIYKKQQLALRTKLQATLLEQQEAATKAVLEAEERERKRIASDLHDGVGQILSAVKMNLSSLTDKVTDDVTTQILMQKTMALVDESCKEVRHVSHNMMPNALLKTGLSNAVKEFIDKIDHHQLQVNLYTEGLQNGLTTHVETILYRVLQEIVNNVIKHAQANQLDISIIKDAEGVSCTIEDNGCGFDYTAMQLHNKKGMGLQNIQGRIQYLKGTVEWDAAIGRGTVVAIYVPLNN